MMSYLDLTTKLAAIDGKYRGEDWNSARMEKRRALILQYNIERREAHEQQKANRQNNEESK